MARYIKDNQLIRGFIMTKNVHCPRLRDKERRLFGLVSNIHLEALLFKYIGIVWN